MQLSPFTWSLYRDSPEGSAIITSFDSEDAGFNILQLIERFNLDYSKVVKHKVIEYTTECLYAYSVSDYEKPSSIEEAASIYEDCVRWGMSDGEMRVIETDDFQTMLALNTPLSFALYIHAPDFFFPNLFVYQFFNLTKIADVFEIALPSIPKKSDHKARCMYYMDLCRVFYEFRAEHKLSPAELCAFLYDYAPRLIDYKPSAEMPHPSQAWFIGGLITEEGDKILDITFWQANPSTRKGDILVHYQTSPTSAITNLWIAQTDGVIDPFFHYYSNTYLGNKIDIPPISLADLEADSYFVKHPLTRKNFQGVNGWAISSEDYRELFRMVEAKGGDTSTLPVLFAPELSETASILLERDVEVELLEPLLTQIGLTAKDYIRQLPIRAGRGHRIYPDYAIFYENTQGVTKAKILIEVKLLMKSPMQIATDFEQARSYANLLESNTLILCDKYCLMVYERGDGFDRDKYTKYCWSEFRDPDVFNRFKRVFSLIL